ncbi:MAG: molybdopterin-dependent oxidoreductase, partial [Actinobacteria bacterium]|nr:molybdopterin-dependent oxidoreductase [Actinomycetota bacterium]
MKTYSVIGKSYPAVGALEKATGAARYAADINLPGLLQAKILRSPLPHARILDVDTSAASRLGGVRAVATGRDTPGVKYGGIRGRAEFRDREGLCVDRVRYVGDAVAAVAAVDEDTAEEALQLIRVEYEELPAVFDPLEAMSPGAPRLHEQAEGNISLKFPVQCGNVEEALAGAYHVREDVFTTQPVSHCYLEPRVAVAQVDPSGKLTLWSSTQAPFFVLKDICATLALDEENVRVVKPYVGGGFGGKLDGMDAADFCAALMARMTGCPVKVTCGRDEEFVASRRRHPTRIELRTGVDRHGIILGRDSKAIFDGGAYNSLGQAACIQGGSRQLLPYRMAHMRYLGIRVYTNKPPSGAMRGFGVPQIHFGVEVQLDMLAEDLGLDPAEIRLRNALRTGDRNPNGFYVVSSGFAECIAGASRRIGWSAQRPALPRGEGVGIGCSGFIC